MKIFSDGRFTGNSNYCMTFYYLFFSTSLWCWKMFCERGLGLSTCFELNSLVTRYEEEKGRKNIRLLRHNLLCMTCKEIGQHENSKKKSTGMTATGGRVLFQMLV